MRWVRGRGGIRTAPGVARVLPTLTTTFMVTSLTNMAVHNMADAKAHLSQLLDAALRGYEVIVARAGKPLVRLVPVTAPVARVLGFLDLPSPDERFGSLDESEVAVWS